MRFNPLPLLSVVLLAVATYSEAQPTRFSQKHLDEFSSVVGVWKMDRGNGALYEEWNRDDGGKITGKSYQITGGVTAPLENVRVFLSDGQIYYAPVAFGQNNEKEVLFALKEVKDGEFIFENKEHDFPQRIMYHVVAGDSLHAYIEGTIKDETKRRNFNYKRQK